MKLYGLMLSLFLGKFIIILLGDKSLEAEGIYLNYDAGHLLIPMCTCICIYYYLIGYDNVPWYGDMNRVREHICGVC